ncbi:hypothetical protein A3K82_02795 [Candidatus Pacearchaeota archaeon RBG_19FT_COMBO_34_9]|nr:MAG: hypothetical protein A3K82_02795 [Candidatus Pacearchaeota archaeon RBG_19FT_COMBO_34_9]OGJ16985.1 MAG: hypothetical protein A3K74_01170 [Candidatus Pacearchaeota archaeon RBG_13_33_26]
MKIKKRMVKPLDYLLIPTGWKRQRKKRAIEELKKRKIKNMLVLNGDDSEEDILYLGKKLRGGERIGFVTFPLHYQEYKEIIKKAQKDRNFPKKIKIENIKTKETPKQFIYGILGLLEERADKKVNYVREEHENWFIKRLKHFIKKILG